MSSIIQCLHLLLITLLIRPILTQTPKTLERQAIPGLYYEEIPSPSTFYESVAPIVYQFSIPKWNSSDMIIPIGTNCSTPEWTESTTCPVRFYLPEVQSRFSEYLLSTQPLVNTFEFINASPQQSEISFECGILSKHFRDIYIDSPVVERYLRKLKKCSPAGEMEFFRKLPNYNYNISEVYLQMKNGFFKEIWLKVHDGRIDAGLWSNALSALNALTFLNYYVEANRWKFGLIDCQAGRIPTTLLPPDLLADTLQDLFENLNNVSLTSVISPEDVGNYYKAEIADCTFTNETLLVRLLIPVTSQQKSHSLLKLTSAKFWYNNEKICSIELPQSEYILMDNMEQIAYATDCKPNELCHVPSVKAQGRINSCASAFVNGHFWNVWRYCKLNCEPISPYHLSRGGIKENKDGSIFIQVVGSDKFLVTGLVNSDGKYKNPPTVRCKGVETDIWIQPVSTGAVEITLPCNCTLIHRNVSFETQSPCEDSVNASAKFVHVIPLHWMNDGRLDELRSKKGRMGSYVLKFDKSDISFRGDSESVKVASSAKLEDNSGSSLGTDITLILYFVFIVCLSLMILFLTFRLKSMGVNVNPFNTFLKGNQEVSYKNVQGGDGLLSQEENH